MTRLALVDCNNFFCSCERVFDPALTDKPVVVLSNNDGCIISRSEEAKALGIPVAQQTLMIARDRFPQDGIIHYNLACYEAVQGHLDDAKVSLARAIELESSFKALALEDEDLKGIW